MKLSLFKKVCLTVMGVGVVSSLVSVGTFATFTATTTNPGNSFAAGTLTLTDTTGSFAAFGTTNPNSNGTTNPSTQAECATAVIASACTSLLKSVNVATQGMEPGQYLQGAITVVNSGTLPAVIAMQVQKLKTNNGNNTVASGATGFSACAGDIAGVAAPGTTGTQLNSTTNSAIVGCNDLGTAMRITIQDAGSIGGTATNVAGAAAPVAVGTGTQCVYGHDNGTANTQAPAAGLSQTYVATGSRSGIASTTGACDNLATVSGFLGSPSTPVAAGANPKDLFGTQTGGATLSTNGFAALNGSGVFVFIPGSSPSKSLTNAAAFGGNLTGVFQWLPGESHTFTVTLALPDTGVTSLTDANGDVYNVSNDNQYAGGASSFDLVWLATQ
jgi:predicted ribosomally synthesized peptide with SipW-like signal peptide